MVEQGALLSAQGIRRTERVAAELFALRKASDECVPLSVSPQLVFSVTRGR